MPLPLIQGRGLAPQLKFQLSGPAQGLRWRLYTRNMVVVAEADLSGSWNRGWNQATLDLPTDLASQVYFLRVWARRGEVQSKPVLVKCMVLR